VESCDEAGLVWVITVIVSSGRLLSSLHCQLSRAVLASVNMGVRLQMFSCFHICRRPPLLSSGQFLVAQRRCIVLPMRYELNLYMLCRRE
jgi:hypothetical protein